MLENLSIDDRLKSLEKKEVKTIGRKFEGFKLFKNRLSIKKKFNKKERWMLIERDSKVLSSRVQAQKHRL